VAAHLICCRDWNQWPVVQLGSASGRFTRPTRRVKLLVLTSAWAQTKDELVAGTYTPPPELLELDRVDLRAFPRRRREAPAPGQAGLGRRG
jgi:hypothetical protein